MVEEIIQIWKPEPGSDLWLDPCPFCGHEEIFYVEYMHLVGPRWKAICGGCCATIDPGYARNRDVIRAMWNRRTAKAVNV